MYAEKAPPAWRATVTHGIPMWINGQVRFDFRAVRTFDLKETEQALCGPMGRVI
jgi:hypothetical protein